MGADQFIAARVSSIGLVSRSGIIPIAASYDTAGPRPAVFNEWP
jgi:hypothetical protein